MEQSMNLILILLLMISSNIAMEAYTYNIVDFGAKADGTSDSAAAFLSAWAKACSTKSAASIYVPAGKFFLSQALFMGPCNNSALKITIDGTLIAPSSYGSNDRWIGFQYVDGMSIYGGTLDGQGQSLWSCKSASCSCPTGATSLAISKSKNVLISGLTSLNSKLMHVLVFESSGVTVKNVKITAPGNSPNTNGIHLQKSDQVTITGSSIGTGDDCISLSQGSTNVWIERVNCGPGHGISIGSLGAAEGEAGVQNITIKTVVFTGTQNGLRIKTWGKPTTGFVTGVIYQNAIMKNVQNPIIVDQNYCTGSVSCPNQSSGVKISDVSYSNIQGTSATAVAMKFDCSATNPCSRIGLQNITLSYSKSTAQSFCKNAMGSTSGSVVPPSCLGYS